MLNSNYRLFLLTIFVTFFQPYSFVSSACVCSEGYYCLVYSSGYCAACGPGNYVFGSSCMSCRSGRYSAGIANTECQSCEAGYVSNYGATFCSACPENTYASFSTCMDCASGYTSPAKSSSFLDCTKADDSSSSSSTFSSSSYSTGFYVGIIGGPILGVIIFLAFIGYFIANRVKGGTMPPPKRGSFLFMVVTVWGIEENDTYGNMNSHLNQSQSPNPSTPNQPGEVPSSLKSQNNVNQSNAINQYPNQKSEMTSTQVYQSPVAQYRTPNENQNIPSQVPEQVNNIMAPVIPSYGNEKTNFIAPVQHPHETNVFSTVPQYYSDPSQYASAPPTYQF